MSVVGDLDLSPTMRKALLGEIIEKYEAAQDELTAASEAHRAAARRERELRQKVLELHLIGHSLAEDDACPFGTHVDVPVAPDAAKSSTTDLLLFHLLDIYPESVDAAAAVEHLESRGWKTQSPDRKNNVRTILNRLARQGRVSKVDRGRFRAVASAPAIGAVDYDDHCTGGEKAEDPAEAGPNDQKGEPNASPVT